ncbi:MAG: hypothetical protein K2J93_03165 [Anaeroplasmataceae bacterium]|nr:hypothetical protein [Anaeroplasmataceae bacterium]
MDLKKVQFTSKEMIIKKKKDNFIIPLDNIKEMEYTKKTFLNYLLIFGLSVSPGWLQIKFKNKIEKRKSYSLKIKYEDLQKFPKEIFSTIEIN